MEQYYVIRHTDKQGYERLDVFIPYEQCISDRLFDFMQCGSYGMLHQGARFGESLVVGVSNFISNLIKIGVSNLSVELLLSDSLLMKPYDGIHCPDCGAEVVCNEPMNEESGTREIDCPSCGKTFLETWKMTGWLEVE